MHFVAESVTEDTDEFRGFCTAFAATVEHGGYLIAAFMENMGRYQLGDGSQWPGIPVDLDAVQQMFAPLTEELRIPGRAPTPNFRNTAIPGHGALLRARRH